MTDPEITQVDADQAASFLESWEPGPEMTVIKLAEIFARHRMLGRVEGAAHERAEIVAWLREKAPQYSHEQLAGGIERGEYKRSE